MDFWCKDKIVDIKAYEAHLYMRRVAIVLTLLEYASFGGILLAQVYLRRSIVQMVMGVAGVIFATAGLFGALRVKSTYVLVHGAFITTIFSGNFIYLSGIFIYFKNYERIGALFLSIPFLVGGIFHICYGIKIDKLTEKKTKLT